MCTCLQVELCSSCFSPFSSSCCLCSHTGRLFVFYSYWTADLIELISFPNDAVRSLSVYSLVFLPVLLLSSLMVSKHCRHFIQFSSFFSCDMSRVYEQLHKPVPLESEESQCRKAWHLLFCAVSELIWDTEESVLNMQSLCRSFCGLQTSLQSDLWCFFICFYHIVREIKFKWCGVRVLTVEFWKEWGLLHALPWNLVISFSSESS